jgi:TolB-like protein/elongation factor P hydroxylase
MSSIVPGYNYDIFISYRQKDNKHDGWVTEFVENLKGELESTFKEEISVYFDFNPHDGLLETHDVDESLKDKLKCLMFIPVISRTYCDPHAFAWEHEFKAFVEEASNDEFGLKIRLPNGNVASRVLPVQIHELDPEDISMFKTVTGSILRGIEFIYKEPGVNRPLTPKDSEDRNVNKTNYRNQINKVANAIKDVISVIKQHPPDYEEVSDDTSTTGSIPGRNRTITIIAVLAAALVLTVSGFIFIPKLFKTEDQSQKSIAVLPFINLSNDPEQEYFSDGMVDAILDNLFKIGGLKVTSRTSSMRYKNSVLSVNEIARELKVSSILEGSVQKVGEKVRITIQLIDAQTDTHLWSDTFDGELTDVFAFQSEVAHSVADEMKIALSPEEVDHMKGVILTSNPVAYDFYLRGNDYWSRYNEVLARDMYSRAIVEDSLFAVAYAKRALMHLFTYWNRNEDWAEHKTDGLRDLQRALEIDPNMFEIRLVEAVKKYWVERDYDASKRLLNELKNIAPNMAEIYFWTAAVLRRQGEFNQCVTEFVKAQEMDPFNARYIQNVSQTYNLLHQYDRMIEWNEKGLSYVPDHKAFRTDIFNAVFLSTGDVDLAYKKSGLAYNDVNYSLNYYSRQFDRIISLIKEQENYSGSQSIYEPPLYKLAKVYFLSGNQSLCKEYADSSISFLSDLIEEFPDEDRFYSTLGRSYALAGNKEEAIKCGEKALELKPLSMDAYQNPCREQEMMEIYILTGDYNRAMDKMEYLLSIPSWLSRGDLIADPLFDKLRDLPRFKKIVESVRNK